MTTKKVNRIYHPWWKWECYKNGFYSTLPPKGLTKEDCKSAYADFLSKPILFSCSIEDLFKNWTHSCDQFLTNNSINRVAWIGQASMCFYTGISSEFKSGFFLLSEKEQEYANQIALNYLNRWINERSSQN